MIDNSEAAELEDEGWHIKYLKPKEEGGDPQAYLPVRVNFDVIPPAVYMVTKKRKTLLTEKTIVTLDNAELTNVDLVISPYFWSIPGKNGGEERGITAYLKEGYFTILESPFYEKYAKFDDEADSENVTDVDDSIDADEIPFS